MFSITGKALSDAFKAAAQAALPKSPLPVFTHIRVVSRADTGGIRLIGTTGYITVSAAADADVDEDVDLCLPADKLNAICSLGAASITFSVEKGKVVARAGRTRMSVPTLPGDIFPMPKLEGEPEASFDSPDLTDKIGTVSFAVAAQGRIDKPILRNLWLEYDGQSAHLVGCDGLMLATNIVPITPPEFGAGVPAFGIAIPDASAAILCNIGADHFEVYKGHLLASQSGIQIICTLAPGRYIDWKRLLPNPNQFVTFSRDDLTKVCPLHRTFDSVGGIIRIEQDGNFCSLAISGDSQSVEADLELKQLSEESHLDASFVGAQLMRLLGQVKTDDVSLSWAQPKDGPPLSYLLQDGSWRGLLQPMRM
ncbi:hypothetical protein [Cupriavidus sp. UBA2534]|uniref:hypothetical protein n=1 Tax=Cupriavidus sp. UBA2534 TaxID=1946399 RepID=UPI000E93E471|nr:hypothetical protein [Cupriavidus sp. UBA2534]HBD35946.1 hypothetical protein [Cupriavidus sp.]